MKQMKEKKLTKKWTIGWYPVMPMWHIGKQGIDSDTDFEICFGCLQFLHWRKKR
jgi:hypothetical protein